MSPIKENHKFLRPFFGAPAHNSKILQILYPLFSVILIAYALKIMPESYKFKQTINSTFSFLTAFPHIFHVAGNILMLSSPFILGILCVVSFIRTAVVYENEAENGKKKTVHSNWNNKVKHTSTYSKINDALYWFGSLGSLFSLAFIIYNIISNTKIEYFKVSGEMLSADKIIIFISAIPLIGALLMSLVSTFVPSLTRPKSTVENANAKSFADEIPMEKTT